MVTHTTQILVYTKHDTEFRVSAIVYCSIAPIYCIRLTISPTPRARSQPPSPGCRSRLRKCTRSCRRVFFFVARAAHSSRRLCRRNRYTMPQYCRQRAERPKFFQAPETKKSLNHLTWPYYFYSRASCDPFWKLFYNDSLINYNYVTALLV